MAGRVVRVVLSGWTVVASAMGIAQGQNFAGSNAHPSADEIVTRMLRMNERRLAALDRYASERTYTVDYRGTGGEHHAELRVHAEYTGPNQKRLTVVAESGPRFLCEKVLRKLVEGEEEATTQGNRAQMALSKENYNAELVGEATMDSTAGPVRAWVLQVTPKVDNKFTYKGQVWVSQDDYAVMRIVGDASKSPSWWINRASIDSRYVRRGDVWLPARNVSSGHVRLGGEATLTIDYGTYPVVEARAIEGPGVVEAVASFPR